MIKMNIKNEIDKVLIKIAKQIHKKVDLPKDVKRYINAEPFAYKLCIKWYYAGDYVYTMKLKPDYYTYFEEVGFNVSAASSVYKQLIEMPATYAAYGYGVVLDVNGERYEFSGSGDDAEMAIIELVD